MTAVIRDKERLDPDALADLLRKSATADFAGLTSLRIERLAEGIGVATDIHRLHLSYATGAASGPASLVMKLPTSNREVRAIAQAAGLYEREVLFYRQIAPTLALRLPKAHAAEFDPATGGFVLILEDLAPALDGDQVAGLSVEHARLALDSVADLHARWWNRPELSALEGIIPAFGQGPWLGIGARLDAWWRAFEPFAAARASPALCRIGARLGAVIEPMMAEICAPSRTLCHGDFRADNLMFAQQDGRPSLVTIDWQWALQARGAVDVSYLVSMSLTTELRRAHEADLLGGYHARLVAGGVEAYPYEAFRDDYFRAVLIGFLHVIQAGSAVDLTHDRTAALFDIAVRRLDATVLDHGLEAFLP